MEKEGVTQAFGVPGAAINPLYAALRERESISHILARHVEGELEALGIEPFGLALHRHFGASSHAV